MYQNGTDVEKDLQIAFKIFLESVEGGSVLRQCYLGHCYRLGLGTIKDEKKAFELYSKSATSLPLGQCYLGYCYELGIGTSMFKPLLSRNETVHITLFNKLYIFPNSFF